MAQKREKEETELKVPESLPLCSLTSPPPQHLSATSAADISDLKLNDSRSNSVASPELTDPKVSSTTEDSRPNSASSSISRSSSATSPEITDLKLSGEARSSSAKSPESVDLVDRRAAVKRPRESTRCSGMGCRRKVGLMPFRCRCGEVYCSEHRYSDRHECSYDYKAAGREAIARENPVVKAAKILRV